jgi:hypothetical protein
MSGSGASGVFCVDAGTVPDGITVAVEDCTEETVIFAVAPVMGFGWE